MNRYVAAGVLAQKSGEAAKAGPIGLAVILLLCIASYFLFKSMSKHMRNVRENFPGQPPVQRVKAPSVHPAALPEAPGPTPEARTGRPRAADPSTDGPDGHPDTPAGEDAP